MEPIKNINYNLDKSRIINLEKGKLPPQAIELEEAVIGAAMIDQKGLDEMFTIINSSNVFYKESHKIIFEAMQKLYSSSKNIDLLTVSNQLKSTKKLEIIGGDFTLIRLTQKVSSSAHIEYHCRIILQKYLMRELIRISSESIEMAYDDSLDCFEIIDNVVSKIDYLTDNSTKGHTSLTWREAILQIPKRVEFLTNNKGKVTGVPSGLHSVDKHFNGWQDGDLIVIGADNGMGKTAFVLGNMLASAKNDMPVGMFSMEMSVIQLAIRGVANESSYHMNQLMRTGFEHDYYFNGLNNVVSSMVDLPIYIDDQPALTVPEMKRKARQLKRKYDIKLLVIDFVQMFSGDKDIRINISEAARELKNIAKELSIPVIALSQLSREVKKEKYKIPSKHHLKESSAIEEAADIIGLIYRPGYYGYTINNTPDLFDDLGLIGDENSCLIVAKNRNGALGNIGLRYIENKTKYVNEFNDKLNEVNDIDSIPMGNPTEAFDSINPHSGIPDWLEED
jgi:replicative DNA helicase